MDHLLEDARPSRAPKAWSARALTAALLGLLVACSVACGRKDAAGASGSCPGDWPAAKGCQSANQECPYDKDGKKWRCTCTPDTQGPSTWQCTPLE